MSQGITTQWSSTTGGKSNLKCRRLTADSQHMEISRQPPWCWWKKYILSPTCLRSVFHRHRVHLSLLSLHPLVCTVPSLTSSATLQYNFVRGEGSDDYEATVTEPCPSPIPTPPWLNNGPTSGSSPSSSSGPNPSPTPPTPENAIGCYEDNGRSRIMEFGFKSGTLSNEVRPQFCINRRWLKSSERYGSSTGGKEGRPFN